MSKERLAIARLLFQRLVLRTSGTPYEDLVCTILERRRRSFSRVKPQGRLGDRGNDGFDRADGTYYQVYAPENPSGSVANAVEKAAADFQKLKAYWTSIRAIEEYRFAFNDRYTGTQPSIETELSGLKSAHSLRDARVFLARDLEEEFLELSEADMVDVIGFLPGPSAFAAMDPGALRDVLAHVLAAPPSRPPSSSLIVPDFDEKVSFNGLGTAVRDFLRMGSYQAAAVEEYFLANSAFERQQVRDAMNGQYQTITQLHGLAGDEAFFDLVGWMTPDAGVAAHELAAFVVISYYFESCDVFEEPGGDDAAS